MTGKAIFLGSSQLNHGLKQVSGDYVSLQGESYYRIENYSDMDDFFISVVSDSDHWLFISSRGGLTAGRVNCDSALFPYYTEDKIRDSSHHTGSRTIALVDRADRRLLWEPFSPVLSGVYRQQRNLYKNVLGDKLIFEEINADLGLRFSYTWSTSDRFGFVRQACIENMGSEPCTVDIVDGIENLLPYGVLAGTQNELSCLVDAYKKNERVGDSVLATYSMSSILSDRAEPSEALSTTTVWSHGAVQPKILLSSLQLDAFRRGDELVSEPEVLGRRGAYFLHQRLALSAGEGHEWGIVADVNQGPAAVQNTLVTVREPDHAAAEVAEDVRRGSDNLRKLVATADGLQVTGDALSANHHAANVLFNIMRGGVFTANYAIERSDLEAFCASWNAPVFEANQPFFTALPTSLSLHSLNEALVKTGDPRLERLCREYLPLSFSRRHGDPSRPWNRFSIQLKDTAGRRMLNYEGNWRDIFQNWEALGTSIPMFTVSMISKFVNASTADGYNPYRITRRGIDWERPEPENPWANIGYWGDHQLIYLLKLIEQAEAHDPSALRQLLSRRIFAYANVPYRIKAYADILTNPNNTIDFDHDLDSAIEDAVATIGADGRLMSGPDGGVYQVTLIEKLMVTLLAKIGNFIPDAGIWMNTQRPEWNDANNALVGTGVSVVTLCYLHRFLKRALSLLAGLEAGPLQVSAEVVAWYEATFAVLEANAAALTAGAVSDAQRKRVMDGLGLSSEAYRQAIYARGFSGEGAPVELEVLLRRLALMRDVSATSIHSNQRTDGLYHAYNRIQVGDEGVAIHYLYEMLEGQVAVLSADVLTPGASSELLASLRGSALYTSRQHSYLLYPDRKLPAFAERNVIPGEIVAASALLLRLRSENNSQLVEWDLAGNAYFSGSFNNTADVRLALQHLQNNGYPEVADESEAIEDLFSRLFDCANFTGRSGGMYAYEGLGSIYWHMVSKLLLAVQETLQWAEERGCQEDTLTALQAAYYEVRAGIGFNKSPDVYGAFPTDPYSHTPGFSGARQPGMTGQVKEEVLTRLGELGVRVESGCVAFRPSLLRRREFLITESAFAFIDVTGEQATAMLKPAQLGFTYCQVPVIYTLGEEAGTTVVRRDGSRVIFPDNVLDAATSRSLFMKLGEIAQVEVLVDRVLD